MRKTMVMLLAALFAGATGACKSSGTHHGPATTESAQSLGGPAASVASSDTPELARTIPLPGVNVPAQTSSPTGIPGRLDHLAYDATTGRLFIAALEEGSVEVVDLETGQRIQRIEGLKKPQGIAVVRPAGYLVVACGGDGTLHSYTLADFSPRQITPGGEDADNVRSDGKGNVYVGFGGQGGRGGLSIFDAKTLEKSGEIPLPSHPESFQFDSERHSNFIFVNLPGSKRGDDDGKVAVVDRETDQTVAVWPLEDAARNFPMAFDAGHERVFVVCRKPAKVICLDSKTGKELSEAPCVADSDDVYYDAKTDRVLVIGGGRRVEEPETPNAPTPGADAALDLFQVGKHGTLSRIASVPTAPHARTGFFVPQRRAVYVVAPPQGKAGSTEDAMVLEFKLGK